MAVYQKTYITVGTHGSPCGYTIQRSASMQSDMARPRPRLMTQQRSRVFEAMSGQSHRRSWHSHGKTAGVHPCCIRSNNVDLLELCPSTLPSRPNYSVLGRMLTGVQLNPKRRRVRPAQNTPAIAVGHPAGPMIIPPSIVKRPAETDKHFHAQSLLGGRDPPSLARVPQCGYEIRRQRFVQ